MTWVGTAEFSVGLLLSLTITVGLCSGPLSSLLINKFIKFHTNNIIFHNWSLNYSQHYLVGVPDFLAVTFVKGTILIRIAL